MKLEEFSYPVTRYSQALEIQKRFHRETATGSHGAGVILSFEHPATLTLGKNASKEFILFGPKFLSESGIDLVSTDRGGEVTGHEPGQLVVYPILNLQTLRIGVRDYIALLEESVITCLKENYSVTAGTDSSRPGVWVGDKKICAVGVRVANHVTLHGLALNVCNSLDIFKAIVPCGLSGFGVTSVEKERSAMRRDLGLFASIRAHLLDELQKRLFLRKD